MGFSFMSMKAETVKHIPLQYFSYKKKVISSAIQSIFLSIYSMVNHCPVVIASCVTHVFPLLKPSYGPTLAVDGKLHKCKFIWPSSISLLNEILPCRMNVSKIPVLLAVFRFSRFFEYVPFLANNLSALTTDCFFHQEISSSNFVMLLSHENPPTCTSI